MDISDSDFTVADIVSAGRTIIPNNPVKPGPSKAGKVVRDENVSGRRAIHTRCPYHETEESDVCPWRVFSFQDGKSGYVPPIMVRMRSIATDIAKPLIAILFLIGGLYIATQTRSWNMNPYEVITKVMPTKAATNDGRNPTTDGDRRTDSPTVTPSPGGSGTGDSKSK